jgi:asparagine synthase (glutamine-hydrolysing)
MAVADGRLYNADELDVPADVSLAQQLIILYERFGFTDALARINGDFAAALFDAADETLWLGRDRVGHRPLYYVSNGERAAFCSQPRNLLEVPGVSSTVNRRWTAVFAGMHYRYFDNAPQESPFLAVNQVPAATAIKFAVGQPALVRRYWQLTDEPDFTDDEISLAAQYRELLLDSVRRRMASTSRAAFTLSGGMDSSSVLAAAVDVSGAKQHAFSSVYADKTYDESEDIKDFVVEKGITWHPVSVQDFDLFDTVRAMVRAHDEPVATATWLSHFLLCETIAAEGFDTLYGGLGGDELNAGEYEYFTFFFADLRRAGSERLGSEIEGWARHHDHPIYRKNRAIAESAIERLTDPIFPGRVRPDKERLERYARTVNPDYFDFDGFQPVHDHPFQGWLKNRTYQDIFRETAPCCLRAEDRNCNAFDLGHCDPFFDFRLMEFMFRVPGEMKIRGGVTKRLLREAMRGILPEATRTRVKKTGWNAPAHLWFIGEGGARMLDLVTSQRFRERGIYRPAEIVRLIGEHRAIVEGRAQRDNHMMFLWQVLNLELWFQEVVDSPVAAGDLPSVV